MNLGHWHTLGVRNSFVKVKGDMDIFQGVCVAANTTLSRNTRSHTQEQGHQGSVRCLSPVALA